MFDNIFNEFSEWLDNILSASLPVNITAFNFNLYEGENSFHIQLIGAPLFSEEDSDWACDEVFSTEENVFIIDSKITGSNLKEGLAFSRKLVLRYLEKGKYGKLLKEKDAVAIGFVDGDLEILYKK